MGGTETVLLVEDQAAVRNYIGEVLKEHGYRVLEAANGMEAVEVSGDYGGRIDLLLTDIVMPGMSASEMTLQFLALRPGTPVLRMSGYPDRLGCLPQLNHGTPSLQKPFTRRCCWHGSENFGSTRSGCIQQIGELEL